MNREEFRQLFGSVYTYSAWIAEQAFDCARIDLAKLTQALRSASPLCIFNPCRKAALISELSTASTSENAGVGLDQCTPKEFSRLKQLSSAYTSKFDFPLHYDR